MKIAIIGIRGIPVIYSAFETFAENLAVELVKKKREISVYCRSCYVDSSKKDYKSVKLIALPTIKSKHFETFIHSFLSTLHACIFAKYDIIYYFGVGSAIFTLLPRIFGSKTVINVDGLDWKREKWGYLAKKYLKLSEYLACIFANMVITDSPFIKNYYFQNYNKKTVYIPYSFQKYPYDRQKSNTLLKRYNLKKRKYFIWVGRIVPDNHLEDLILAFRKLKSDFKCVIVGEDLYGSLYKKRIFALAKDDTRIIFTGFIERQSVYILEKNCFAYVETKQSGGTHQSLIEALGMGCFIIASDFIVNKQILGSSCIYYNQKSGFQDLQKKLEISLVITRKVIDNFKTKSANLAKINFDLKKIVKKYESLFKSLDTRGALP